MARVLRLTDNAGSDYVDLLATSTYGWKVERDSWLTSPTEDLIEEEFGLSIVNTDTNVRTYMGYIDAMKRKAEKWHSDPLSYTPYFLRAYSDGETAKQALIYGIDMLPVSMGKLTPLLGANAMKYALRVTRHPLWEATSTTGDNTTAKSAIGGYWAPSLTFGSAPSRISNLAVQASATLTTALTKLWVGIRPTYAGLGFDPVMEAEDGTNYNSAADTVDAGARGGYKVSTPALGATLTKYMRITLGQHDSANKDLYYGKYLVLGRLAVVGSGTIAVVMKWGNTDSTLNAVVPCEPVYLSTTAWDLVELGEVRFPSLGRPLTSSYLSDDGIEIHAQAISGTPVLDIDCLVLIPASHMVKANGTYTVYSSPDTNPTWFYTLEDDSQLAHAAKSNLPAKIIESQFNDWVYPAEGGALVVAGTRGSGTKSDLNDTVDLSILTLKRWYTHAA